MSVLDPTPEFELQDGFRHALLGLLSLGEELDELLGAETHAEGPPIEDALMYAALGLVRLRGRIDQVVSSWATDAAPEPVEERKFKSSQVHRRDQRKRNQTKKEKKWVPSECTPATTATPT